MRIVEGPFRAEVYPVRDPKTLTFSYYRYVITRANDEMLFQGLARDKGEAEEAVLFVGLASEHALVPIVGPCHGFEQGRAQTRRHLSARCRRNHKSHFTPAALEGRRHFESDDMLFNLVQLCGKYFCLTILGEGSPEFCFADQHFQLVWVNQHSPYYFPYEVTIFGRRGGPAVR